jgi:hypothetical protein
MDMIIFRQFQTFFIFFSSVLVHLPEQNHTLTT